MSETKNLNAVLHQRMDALENGSVVKGLQSTVLKREKHVLFMRVSGCSHLKLRLDGKCE